MRRIARAWVFSGLTPVTSEVSCSEDEGGSCPSVSRVKQASGCINGLKRKVASVSGQLSLSDIDLGSVSVREGACGASGLQGDDTKGVYVCFS